jgi:hypothetical protein
VTYVVMRVSAGTVSVSMSAHHTESREKSHAHLVYTKSTARGIDVCDIVRLYMEG